MKCARDLVLITLLLACSSVVQAVPIFFDIYGEVTQADEYSSVSVGDEVRGWVKIAEEAASPGARFNLGEGNVLGINVKVGDFLWNHDDPSIDWVQFEGFISADGLGFDTMVWKLLQNVSGVISDQCPAGHVCSLQGDTNSADFWYPNFEFGAGPSDGGFSLLEFEWTRRPIPVPEPSTLPLFVIGLAGLGLARRRRGIVVLSGTRR